MTTGRFLPLLLPLVLGCEDVDATGEEPPTAADLEGAWRVFQRTEVSEGRVRGTATLRTNGGGAKPLEFSIEHFDTETNRWSEIRVLAHGPDAEGVYRAPLQGNVDCGLALRFSLHAVDVSDECATDQTSPSPFVGRYRGDVESVESFMRSFDTGNMVLIRTKEALEFSLHVTLNEKTGAIDGTITDIADDGTAFFDGTLDPDLPCRLSLVPDESGAIQIAQEGACVDYAGMNVSFAGTYFPL